MSMQDFVEYIRVLLKRWWLFLILCGTTLGAILFSFYAGPPQYEASLGFLVNAPPYTDVTLYPGLDRPSQRQQIAVVQSAYMEILRGPTVIWRTAEAIGGSMDGGELGSRVTVEKPLESEFVWVSVVADEPQEAADLANKLVEIGKQYYGQVLAEPAASSRESTSVLVQEAVQGLQQAQQALTDFRREHQVNDLPAQISSQRTIVWNLILERDDALVTKQTGKVAAYDQIIAQHEAELQRLNALSAEYEALQDDIRRTEAYYGFLLDKETEAKLKENEILRTGFIQVVQPARPPNQPVSPFNAKIFVVGAISSLLLSIVLAFVMEYVESRRPERTREEVLSNAL